MTLRIKPEKLDIPVRWRFCDSLVLFLNLSEIDEGSPRNVLPGQGWSTSQIESKTKWPSSHLTMSK